MPTVNDSLQRLHAPSWSLCPHPSGPVSQHDTIARPARLYAGANTSFRPGAVGADPHHARTLLYRGYKLETNKLGSWSPMT